MAFKFKRMDIDSSIFFVAYNNEKLGSIIGLLSIKSYTEISMDFIQSIEKILRS